MPVTISDLSNLFKRVYSGKAPESVALRDHPFMMLLPKESGPFGQSFYVPVIYSNGQGVGANFALGQGQVSGTKSIAWNPTPKDYFGFTDIDRNALWDSNFDAAAYVKAKQTEMDGVLETMGDALSLYLLGDGNSSLGRRASISGNIVTLATPEDAKNFWPGMTVSAATGIDGTGARTGTTTVDSVDADVGTVTLVSAAAIASFTNNDYLFRAADAAASVVPTGLGAHIPLTAPTPGESFMGVDRTKYVQGLAGTRYTVTGSIKENTQSIAAKVARLGGKQDAGFLHPDNWTTLSKDLQSDVVRDPDEPGTYGLDYIKMKSASGTIRWYSEPQLRTDRGYMTRMQDWRLRHRFGQLISLVDEDGLVIVRKANSNSFECRFQFSGELYNKKPLNSCVFQIS